MKKLIIIFLLLLIPSISYADLTLTEGTAIDLSSAGAGADVTVDVDTTEVEATTWGAGGNASNLWTFDVSGTDTTMLLGNGTVSFSGTAIANAFTGDLTGAVTGAASGNLLNSASDTMVGTLTADGFTIGANKIITLGSNTVMHNGTDFVFDDKVTSTGLVIGSADVTEAELEILDGATLTTTELNYVDGVTSAIQTQIETKGVGDLLADGSIPLTANWDVGSFTVTAGGFALAQDEFLTLGSNTVIHNGTDFNFDDTILWSGGGSANADIGYTHSQDNTQAHTDYLLNSGNDTSAGTISAAGFNSTSTIATYGTNTVDFDTTDNYVLTFDDASKSWRGEVAGSGAGDLKADGSVPLTDNWDVGSYTITAGGFAVAQGEFATYGANTVHHDGTDFKFDDTITWSGGTSANADIGYTHSQDNSQAHTDYLLNSGNDTTSGTLTSTGFIIGSASVDEAELEILDGATLNTTDINIIDGVGDSGSLTATELLYVDGVTSAIQTQIETKGVGDLLADGSVPLTDNWDVGSYTVTANGFTIADNDFFTVGSFTIYSDGTALITYGSTTYDGIEMGSSTDQCAIRGEGFWFYNDVDHFPCWCDDSAAAVRFWTEGSTTVCFN